MGDTKNLHRGRWQLSTHHDLLLRADLRTRHLHPVDQLVRARQPGNSTFFSTSRVWQSRACEGRTDVVCTSEVRAAVVRFGKIRAAKIRAGKVRASKRRAAGEVCAAEPRAGKVRIREGRAPKVRAGK